MYYCQHCGGPLELLRRAVSCGGNGDIYGCPNPNCDRLYEQQTGGFIPTPGGETLAPIEGSYKEFKREQKNR